MPSNILIKRSSTASAIPTAQQLLTGELAINLADKKLYTNNNGSIIELGTLPSSLSVSGDTALTTLDVTGATTLTSGNVSGTFTVVGTLVVPTPTGNTDAASKAYVDTAIAGVIDTSPELLNTLNELAAAINDDPNFATTITTSIATKVAKAGDTLTGDLVMGGNKITSTATPVTDDTLTRKGYVDSIFSTLTAAETSATASAASAVDSANSASASAASATTATTQASSASTSATSSASSASAASTSASSASTSATASATSATASATSAANAESAWDSFDDRYLGAKASAPTLDNDGNTLLEGTLYWNTVTESMYVYSGISWMDVNAVDSVAGRTGNVVLTKGDVGLSNVDNTSDVNKPLQVAQPTSRCLTSALTLSNTVNQVTFDAITYTGNGTSQTIATGMSTIDFTQASNGTGFYHDRAAGDCIVKNDAGTVQESGSIAFMDVAGVDGVCQVHIKSRSAATGNVIIDGIRGQERRVYTNNTTAEDVPHIDMLTFSSTGFTLGVYYYDVNNSGVTFIAYTTLYTHIRWGLTNQGKRYVEAFNPVTNDTMVMYQGSGVAGHEIPHSVGVALDQSIFKNLSNVKDWMYSNSAFLQDDYLYLSSTAVVLNNTVNGTKFNTASIVLTGTNSTYNASDTYILYGKAKSKTWTIVPYTGTGAAGNFVQTLDSEGVARRPARVIIKAVSATGSWTMLDNARGEHLYLYLDLSNTEADGTTNLGISPSPNGFAFLAAHTTVNASGTQYIALVEFDTNNTGSSGSYEDLPSATTNVQIQDGTFLYSEEADGYKQTKETFAGTTTMIPSNGWGV